MTFQAHIPDISSSNQSVLRLPSIKLLLPPHLWHFPKTFLSHFPDIGHMLPEKKEDEG